MSTKDAVKILLCFVEAQYDESYVHFQSAWDKVSVGNKQAREGTPTFLIRHSSERSHFIFSNTLA